MTLLIGLHGKAGVGKDTAGDYLAEQGFVRYALADPIKHGLCAMLAPLGLTMDHFRDRRLKEQPLPVIGKSPRQLAQTLGTEWGRVQVNADIWLALGEAVYRDVADNGARGCVFTDCRFPNEAAWIHDMGGQVWAIDRRTDAVATHSSELGLSDRTIDFHIMNNGSFAHLYYQLDYALALMESAA